MRLLVGQTLRSVTDTTTVIVVRVQGDHALTCGGRPMVDARGATPGDPEAADPQWRKGTQLGKRYEDAAGQVEVLCTKAGSSSLALDGAPLAVKEAKALPASD